MDLTWNMYDSPKFRKDLSKNIPFTIGNKTEMWNKIMKEVSLQRYARPFDSIPFEYYIQSPIGLVPKARGQTSLIFHLSHDVPSGNKSVNYYTPHSKCTVKYRDLDHAVVNSLRLLKLFKQNSGRDGTLWYSKTDVKF